MAEYRTARHWLADADWQLRSLDLTESFIATVGYDKAEEVVAALERISVNLLDALDSLLLSEQSVVKLQRAVASIAIDNYLASYRNE